MKQHFIFGLVVLLLMVLVPLVSLTGAAQLPEDTQATTGQAAATKTQAGNTGSTNSSDAAETIDVVRTASGKTENIAMREYIIGCVAAEMEAGSHLEALKAQAVASYTYARYCRESGGQATLSDSGESDQCYESAEQRKERWGSNYDIYEAKVEQAVDAVLGQTIVFEGKPILAAYFAVSAGRTESAEHYWGSKYAYLVSVDSPGDKLSHGYTKTITLKPDEVEKALKKTDGVKLGKDPAKWFGEPERSEAGTVRKIETGGASLTGRQLRELLELRSANFTIAYKNEAFQITCLGFGHGVGMSQYGADFMARQGSSYKEILEHYYTGCTVV